MPIYYKNTLTGDNVSISSINYTVDDNTDALQKVFYTTAGVSTMVWPDDVLVDYTFPNSRAYQSYGTGNFNFASFGSPHYEPKEGSTIYAVYKAFDNSVAYSSDAYNYFCMLRDDVKNDKICGLGFEFPWDVQIQSITIKDALRTPSRGSAWGSIPHSGKIYVTTKSGRRTLYTDGEIYDEFDRSVGLKAAGVTNADTYLTKFKNSPYTTVHTNPDFASKFVRGFCIDISAWGGKGANGSMYRVIGEVTVDFKVRKSDLDAWEEKFKNNFH